MIEGIHLTSGLRIVSCHKCFKNLYVYFAMYSMQLFNSGI